MPVPKRKTSKARRDKRSAGKHIDRNLPGGQCPTCQTSLETHRVCSECGYYKGVKVMRTKLDRLETRRTSVLARKKSILSSRSTSSEQNPE